MTGAGLAADGLDPGVRVVGANSSLNGGTHAVNHALRDEIAEAVRQAAARGTFAKVDIARRFAGRAGQSTLFRLIKLAVESQGVATIKKPVNKLDPALEAEGQALAARASAAIERAELSPVTDKPVDMIATLHAGLQDLNRLIALAKGEDGRICNARLLATAVDLQGRCVERLSRVRASLSDESQVASYVRALGAAIMEEEPAVRQRIASKLRHINASFGVL